MNNVKKGAYNWNIYKNKRTQFSQIFSFFNSRIFWVKFYLCGIRSIMTINMGRRNERISSMISTLIINVISATFCCTARTTIGGSVVSGKKGLPYYYYYILNILTTIFDYENICYVFIKFKIKKVKYIVHGGT